MSSKLGPSRPFPGLRPYAVADHEWFFGRTEQSLLLYRMLVRGRLVAVVGASGSGKSSLVRAGLLPLLDEETAERSGRYWRWWSVAPGGSPIESLVETLSGALEDAADDTVRAVHAARRERLAFVLRKSSLGLVDALREIAVDPGAIPVIVVDQFEQLFRFVDLPGSVTERARRRDEAAAFVQLLLEATRSADLPVRIVVTMRSDYLGDCAIFQRLPEAISSAEFLVPLLTRDQREQVIRGPIEKAGASIADELVEHLLSDSNDERDQLAVLQYALMQTWNHAVSGDTRRLRLADYEAIGGIASAISQHGEELLAQPELQNLSLAVEQVFRALTDLDRHGHGIRRPLPYGELVAETAVPEADVRAVVDRFRSDDCGFLVPPLVAGLALEADDTVDIGHEALIRCWTRMTWEVDRVRRGWLFEEEADGRAYAGLLSVVRRNTSGAAATLPAKQMEKRTGWWYTRPRTSAWAERYGGDFYSVEKLISDSAVQLSKLEQLKVRATVRSTIRSCALAVACIALPLALVTVWKFYQADEQRRVAQEEATRSKAALEQIQIAKGGAEQDVEGAAGGRPLAERTERRPLPAPPLTPRAASQANDQSSVTKVEAKRTKAAIEQGQDATGSAEPKVATVAGNRTLTEKQRLLAQPLAPRAASQADEYRLDAKVEARRTKVALEQAQVKTRSAEPKVATVAENRTLTEKQTPRAQPLTPRAENPQADTEVPAVRIDPAGATALSRRLDALSYAELSHSLDRALLLSLAARSVIDSALTRDGLLRALQRTQHVASFLSGHEGGVDSVAFSPNGRLLASGSEDGHVILWDVVKRSIVGMPLVGHTGQVSGVAFSPDGTTLVSVAAGELIFWDTADGKRQGVLSVRKSDAVPTTDVKDRSLGMTSVVFSPDGKTLAAGSKKNLLLFDVASHKALGTQFVGHTDRVMSVAFNPGGRSIATGGADGRVILWDLASGNPLKILTGSQAGKVTSVAFSPDGKTLAAGSSDASVVWWDLASRKPVGHSLKGHREGVTGVAFSPDGKTIASASLDHRVMLWNFAAGRPLMDPLVANQASALSLAFSPDGKTLASGAADHRVTLWDITDRTALGVPLAVDAGGVMSVAFSPDSKTLASGGTDGRILLWDPIHERRIGAPLAEHTRAVTSLAFSANGKTLASGSLDKSAVLWDVASHQPIHRLRTQSGGSFEHVAFSADGKMLLAGGDGKRLMLWDVASGAPLGGALMNPQEEVLALALSPDGKIVASGGADRRVTLWDVSKRSRQAELIAERAIVSIAFSPDGRLLAAGGVDQRVTLWDTRGRRWGEPLTGHQDDVLGVAFSADSKLLASTSKDGRVILWDIANRQALGEALTEHTDGGVAVAFSPDGKLLASSGYDRRIFLSKVDAKEWARTACMIANRNFTRREWRKDVGENVPYTPMCPGLPVPADD